ncbi:hypothetical protein CB1_001669003 [Camelus ferus]|nr:hypothetical protein CB1_001669003 [Camelus ferus]
MAGGRKYTHKSTEACESTGHSNYQEYPGYNLRSQMHQRAGLEARLERKPSHGCRAAPKARLEAKPAGSPLPSPPSPAQITQFRMMVSLGHLAKGASLDDLIDSCVQSFEQAPELTREVLIG